MSSHHVTHPPRIAVTATEEAQRAAVTARRDGLTPLECQRVYANVYRATIERLTAKVPA